MDVYTLASDARMVNLYRSIVASGMGIMAAHDRADATMVASAEKQWRNIENGRCNQV